MRVVVFVSMERVIAEGRVAAKRQNARRSTVCPGGQIEPRDRAALHPWHQRKTAA